MIRPGGYGRRPCDHDRDGRRREIHDRSPLVLPDEMLDAWLDPKMTDPESVRELIGPVPPPVLNPYPVSKAVNNVRNNSPELLSPVPA